MSSSGCTHKIDQMVAGAPVAPVRVIRKVDTICHVDTSIFYAVSSVIMGKVHSTESTVVENEQLQHSLHISRSV